MNVVENTCFIRDIWQLSNVHMAFFRSTAELSSSPVDATRTAVTLRGCQVVMVEARFISLDDP